MRHKRPQIEVRASKIKEFNIAVGLDFFHFCPFLVKKYNRSKWCEFSQGAMLTKMWE